MKNYENIFKNHDGFISHKWIHYFYIYDLLFAEYRKRSKSLTVMEIGVDRGGSLEIWKKYLPKGSKIHGVDINPKCRDIKFGGNIYFHLGNASDYSFMEKEFSNTEFDFILDDGSHVCSEVIETFRIMFPKIKPGGLYVVEDLHTSYWADYGGGCRKEGTSIEYFKKFVEALNSDYIKDFNEENYSQDIESITFYDSVCAVKKFSSPKNHPFKSVITGNENIGGITCFKNEQELIQRVKNMFGG
ncbi:MAG: class I SAM-dependent methyltransferase [Treponema sp.]|jgi:cephalosporin hydroxylase|nr:class I SAM-dependent methyltransferase [Treponema sp.]